MKFTLSLFLALAFHQLVIGQVPTITSFSPGSGPIGSVVTISGNNFDPEPSKNIVFFGAVRANVLSASSEMLTVQVPIGSTHEPISVATNNLIAFSAKPFIQTFTTKDTALTTSSFSTPLKEIAAQRPVGIVTVDLDHADEKTEVIVSTPDEVSVYRNNSSSREVRLLKIGFPLGGTRNVSVCDLNGDGWPDLVTSNGSGSISIITNGSDFGFLTLKEPREFPMGQGSNAHLGFNDIDGDGRMDISATDGSNNVLVLRNTTVNKVISFAPVQVYPAGLQPHTSILRDLDGDKKPDLVVSNRNSLYLSGYRNTSSPDSISFASRLDLLAPLSVGVFSLSDIDGDGKQDIVAGRKADSSIIIFRNMSTVNNIHFEGPKSFAAELTASDICVQDFDGDGRPDIAAVSLDKNFLCVLKNRSSIGNISMQQKVVLASSKNSGNIAAGDFDGDGKTDLVVTNYDSSTISVYRNTIGETSPMRLCPPMGRGSLLTELSGQNYTWQVDKGVGFVNISNDANYSGAATNTLQLINVPAAWYGYKYRCVVDYYISDMFELKFVNSWTGGGNNLWSNTANWNCGSLPDKNTDVLITSGEILLNTNATIRSLVVSPGATVKIAAGFNLTVLQ